MKTETVGGEDSGQQQQQDHQQQPYDDQYQSQADSKDGAVQQGKASCLSCFSLIFIHLIISLSLFLNAHIQNRPETDGRRQPECPTEALESQQSRLAHTITK